MERTVLPLSSSYYSQLMLISDVPNFLPVRLRKLFLNFQQTGLINPSRGVLKSMKISICVAELKIDV